MRVKGQYLAFFSATNSTQALVREIAKRIGLPIRKEYNITKNRAEGAAQLDADDLLIIGVPSYAGRVPVPAVEQIENLKGKNTPAVILCTYGNRDFDDTLLELRDLVSKNGFRIIAAGAFVARHSIFPKVGADRPNEEDGVERELFAVQIVKLLNELEEIEQSELIQVKGNYPYRETGNIPLKPSGNRKCDECGTCVKLCPTDAISMSDPRKTDTQKCISCARCIAVCPQKARAFRGLVYKIASYKFTKKHQGYQPNVVFYI